MSDPQPRRYRHRGPRRASGGTWTAPEPEDGPPAPAEGERPQEPAQPSDPGAARPQRPGAQKDDVAKDRAAKDVPARGDAPLDARARWLMEERPPHWG